MLFRLSDVKKSYGGTEILRGVSFQINPGEKVGLVGRNGAGKTTVFNLITGEEAPDSGDIVSMNGLRLGLLRQHVDFEPGETVHTAALSAFKEIHDIEAEMRSLERRMETDHSAEVLDRYSELQIAFEHADGFSYSARAEAILMGMGFATDSWTQPAETLSGGQKNRLGMVRLLLSGADVLLLDEPTNHLDVNAVEWLENFLHDFDRAYVVISHDRYFLDRTTDRIVEIENGRAVSYKGNYSRFVVERELRREQQQREYDNQQALISKTQEFIRRNLEGQKTKQAKSRRNMLERLERVEAVSAEKHGGNFGLKKVERTGNNVLTVEDLRIGYGDRTLAANLNFSLMRGEVLGIIGGNGTGKTTLLKTILGELGPLAGKIHWGTKTDIGYYTQNLDDLEYRNEVIQELRRVAPLADGGELRSFLSRFLFFGDDVFKSVADLSGGEKGRLALAKLIYSRKNVLILDEPTNHLDIPSREALETALEEYDGTIVAVSHDRFFLDKIATQILAFEQTGVDVFNGNYTEFHDWRDAEAEKRKGSNTAESGVAGTDEEGEPATATKTDLERSLGTSGSAVPRLSKNQRDRIEKYISSIESDIAALEDELGKLSAEMALPEVAGDYSRFQKVSAAVAEKETRIRELYDEWESKNSELQD